jgi:hypothetical protein
MKISSELKSNLENLRYYISANKKLVEQQLEADIKRGEELGIAMHAGTLRYDALAVIHMTHDLFETYIKGIETNLATAEAQDKILNKVEVEPNLENMTPEQRNVTPDVPFWIPNQD